MISCLKFALTLELQVVLDVNIPKQRKRIYEELVNSLKEAPYSLIIDETTDVTRQYNKKSQSIKCSLYELIEVVEGNAEALFQAICHMLENNGIPITNIIGFATDTTNVMFGQHSSAVSRLKDKHPNLFVLRCIYHSAHLCASRAYKKLPCTAEELIHNVHVYNYFCHIAKRQAEF